MAPTVVGSGLRQSGRQAALTERVLAVSRAFLTVTALMAIYLDPSEPARLREVTYGVLLGYAVYSLAVLAYVNSSARPSPRHGLVLHGLDILWTSGRAAADGTLVPCRRAFRAMFRREAPGYAGSGPAANAKFLVQWTGPQEIGEPLVEAVVVGRGAGAGISFTSVGRHIADESLE